jgi:uncharacterized membrane protein
VTEEIESTEETNVESSEVETPSADEIIAEAQRRVEARADEPQIGEKQRGLLLALNRGVFWFSKHWLMVFNLLAGLYIGGAVLAPILMQLGQTAAAEALYTFYRLFCHQYPQRSWFLFGERAAYSLDVVMARPGMEPSGFFLGNAAVGYKIAVCQRDVAIYGSFFLGGLVYALLEKRWDIPPLPIWAYVVFGILPMGIDGGYQLLTKVLSMFWPAAVTPHETTPFLRTLTGLLFGLGSLLVVYPRMAPYFDETRQLLAERYGWESTT